MTYAIFDFDSIRENMRGDDKAKPKASAVEEEPEIPGWNAAPPPMPSVSTPPRPPAPNPRGAGKLVFHACFKCKKEYYFPYKGDGTCPYCGCP